MATFNIVLDQRRLLKDGKYNLTVRVTADGDVMYLNIAPLSVEQYQHIFVKKATDEDSIKFREDCNKYISKCERIYSSLNPYDKGEFRKLFYQEEKLISKELLIRELFEKYMQTKDLKPNTIVQVRTSKNVFETYNPNTTVFDVTSTFLKNFEKKKLEDGVSLASVGAYTRNLRSVINHFTQVDKLIPESYQYPFGKGGYSVSNFFPKKVVLTNEDIQKIVNMIEFDNKKQEYARDLWLLSYRCNGINFVDLLKLRWDNIKGDYIIITRTKTETTRKNNITEIVIPLWDKLKTLINKVGDKESPFILGLNKEGCSDSYLRNKSMKYRKKINLHLREISNKLKLTLPLTLETARDAYATTLLRSGKSKDEISTMLGHSNSVVTEHYLGSLDLDKIKDINKDLY